MSKAGSRKEVAIFGAVQGIHRDQVRSAFKEVRSCKTPLIDVHYVSDVGPHFRTCQGIWHRLVDVPVRFGVDTHTCILVSRSISKTGATNFWMARFARAGNAPGN
eukprot:110503-Amphidinium_carterae.1